MVQRLDLMQTMQKQSHQYTLSWLLVGFLSILKSREPYIKLIFCEFCLSFQMTSKSMLTDAATEYTSPIRIAHFWAATIKLAYINTLHKPKTSTI